MSGKKIDVLRYVLITLGGYFIAFFIVFASLVNNEARQAKVLTYDTTFFFLILGAIVLVIAVYLKSEEPPFQEDNGSLTAKSPEHLAAIHEKNNIIADLQKELVELKASQGEVQSIQAEKDRLKENVSELSAKNQKLETEILSLKKEIEEQSSSNKTSASVQKTQNATIAKKIKYYEELKEVAMPLFVKVALKIGEKGEKKYHKREIVKFIVAARNVASSAANSDASNAMSENMISLFWKCLPDEYANRGGGAPPQS